jgi:Fe-Mn family superoxide dismutase
MYKSLIMKNITRRNFFNNAIKATVAGSVAIPYLFNGVKAMAQGSNEELLSSSSASALQFSQIKLPYDYAALEPNIDATTMDIHYNKHHAAYIKNVNEAIAAENISFATEKEFFANASKLSAKARNNGGGAWNHNFFWQCMMPNAGGTPYGKIVSALDGAFGSVPKFKEAFTTAAMTRFGSGWAWLVKDASGKLVVTSTPNQDNPLMDTAEVKGTPILALDVWEHAYYLKYQNKRNEYVANWFNTINWEEVAKRLA